MGLIQDFIRQKFILAIILVVIISLYGCDKTRALSSEVESLDQGKSSSQLMETPQPFYSSVTLSPTKIREIDEDSKNNITLDNDLLKPLECVDNWCSYTGHFVLNRPISKYNNDYVDSSYRYGSTQNGVREEHHGVEFNNPTGTIVFAAADGIVEYAGKDDTIVFAEYNDFYGNLIILRHESIINNDVLYTLYAHLSEIKVREGQLVKAKQIIGKVGTTGTAIGSHLHFEVRVDTNTYNSTENPELWVKFNNDPETNTEYGALSISISEAYTIQNNAEIIIEDLDRQKKHFEESYDKDAPSSPLWLEVFAMSDLLPGKYRVTLYNNGDFFEEFFRVESGTLTHITLN